MPAHPLPVVRAPRRGPGHEQPPDLDPSTPAPMPSRDEARCCHSYLIQGKGIHADLKLLNRGGRLWVIKDFALRSWWIRWTIGLWLIHREVSALRKLKGIAGIPQPAGRIDRFALAYPYADGSTLERTSPKDLTADFFTAYESLLEAMHARGVVHLNLGSGANVLVTPAQRPVLIDFQSHVSLPRWLFRLGNQLEWLDFRSFNTFWNRYLLEQLRMEEQRQRPGNACPPPARAIPASLQPHR
ncbi:MAG: hypothetical protein K0S46_1038 [Moraxellaceae bacterium]|nr:hypothetical protein [Moraxellaceae bacterium]